MDKEVHKQLETFFSHYKPQTYRKGEIIIRADEEPAGIYYLTKGTVKMYLILEKGDEVVLTIFKPYSFFPMFCALNDIKNNYYFEAMTEVVLQKAPRQKVMTFLHKQPEVMWDLLARLYRGMDGILTRMAYLMSGNARTRLITELLITAKRFGKQKAEGIALAISEKDLGAQTGLTRETVSREIKVLKQEGLVTFTKNVLLLTDIKALEEVLHPGC